ncbi:MAG: hypothetical protein PHR14_10320 [Oscillospiraceae bacterium]|nr:hypothetical protein [Oscillospiraceae bacterium]
MNHTRKEWRNTENECFPVERVRYSDGQNGPGLKEQYEYEHNMYELRPAPVRLDWQEYIDLYFTERDDKYFYRFLHCYEKSLNKAAEAMADKYHMSDHFTGIKCAMVCGMFRALREYDCESGIPFLAFQKSYFDEEAESYVRTQQSGVITMTTDTWPVLKKVMAIFHANGDKNDGDSIQRIENEVGLSIKTTRTYISIGLLNERRADFYPAEDDNDFNQPDDVTRDDTSNPEHLYFRMLEHEAARNAFDTLTYREQQVVAARLAFCSECFETKEFAIDENGEIVLRNKEKKYFADIALSHQLASAEAAENIYYGALEKMNKNINSI